MAVRKIDKYVLVITFALVSMCLMFVGATAYFAYKEENDLIPLGIAAFFTAFGVIVLWRPVQMLMRTLDKENKP